MDNIGQINDKEIYYLSVKQTPDWANNLPSKGWIVVPIVDNQDTKLFDKVAHTCLDKNVLYVCTVGQECEWGHDWFDETILANRIDKKLPITSPDDFEEEPMTTWHNDFDEGVWFATAFAYPTINEEYMHVDKIVCLDLTDISRKQHLAELISKINSGWLPSDNDK